MKTLSVHIAPKETHCEIEFPQDFDALEKALRKQIGKRNFLIVSDTNVEKHTSFLKRFKKDEVFLLDPKTDRKDWEGLRKIIAACFEKNLDRSSVLVAIGGGVVGDMGGFAASILMRGIPIIQVSTTLLGMVDASVGGKTAINCEQGKNLLGSFHHPEKVFCCEEFLETLPETEIKNGICEMIKHGIITSMKHFEDLEKIANPHPTARQIFPYVTDSIAIKADIVSKDSNEKGIRLQLNLGHTFGHALELLSDMKIPHGRAVAIGTVMAANYALEHGLCDDETVDRIENIFNQFDIDLICDFDEKEIWEAMKHDKKKKDGKIRLVLPKKIGEVEVVSV